MKQTETSRAIGIPTLWFMKVVETRKDGLLLSDKFFVHNPWGYCTTVLLLFESLEEIKC